MNKIYVFIMCLILTICFASCTKNELYSFKIEVKKELNAYVNSLNENNYTQADWTGIRRLLKNKKNLIDKQNNIDDILKIKNSTIIEIDKIKPIIITNEWIMKHFDKNDEKKIWNGNINDNFDDTVIIVTLKKTNTYPELDLNCFNIDNALYIKYVDGVNPPDYLFQPENRNLLEEYRQVIFIYFDSLKKTNIIETIRKIEQLEFVKRVSLNYIVSGV